MNGELTRVSNVPVDMVGGKHYWKVRWADIGGKSRTYRIFGAFRSPHICLPHFRCRLLGWTPPEMFPQTSLYRREFYYYESRYSIFMA